MPPTKIERMSPQDHRSFGISKAHPLLTDTHNVGVTMGVTELSPGTVETHQPYDEAIYVIDGAVEVDGDGETFELTAGDCLWLPRNHPVVYRAKQACRYIYIAPTSGNPSA